MTKCYGEKCPIKNKCLRYTMESKVYNWYSVFKFDLEKNKCDFFVEN